MSVQIAVIGDGAMATVCSLILAGNTRPERAVAVRMWGRNPERVRAMDEARENRRYLPGVTLPANLACDPNPATAFAGADYLVCAVPTQHIAGALAELKPHLRPETPIISVSKGIEVGTMRRPSEIIAGALGSRAVAAVSGPNIAGELARKLPATMVAAAERAGADGVRKPDEALSREIQELFSTPYLRVYRNSDLLGVELAGALKNVIAISAGILDGMEAGFNCKAALLTRGLVEMSRLGEAMGAEAETFAGLAGLGDLVTTCFSPEGRNRAFGEKVGRGGKPEEILKASIGVVEGVPTTKAVLALAGKLGVEMPITRMLHAVLFEGKNPHKGIADLMAREPKREA